MAETIKYHEIGAKRAPFNAKSGGGITYDKTQKGGSAQVGKCVKLTGQAEVDLTADTNIIFGRLEKVEPDGVCTVTYAGFVELPTTGTITYDTTNDGLIGSATAGVAKASTAAATNCGAIQNTGTNKTMARLK